MAGAPLNTRYSTVPFSKKLRRFKQAIPAGIIMSILHILSAILILNLTKKPVKSFGFFSFTPAKTAGSVFLTYCIPLAGFLH